MGRKSKPTRESVPDKVDNASMPTPSSNNSDELTPEQIQEIIKKMKRNLTEVFENADSK